MPKKTEGRAQTIGGAGFYDKLLVIGDDAGFSDMLKIYALDMAMRMGYSIVALNYRFLPRTRLRGLGPDEIKQKENELKEDAKAAVAEFESMARERGVGFESATMIGDLDSVVHRVYKERGDIDLVLMEPEFVNEAEEGPRSIPAFCLAANEY
ncbi:MAG: hypothetical protein ACNS63_03415 [Candidatus Nitrospinota bacterium M3_3B_026]